MQTTRTCAFVLREVMILIAVMAAGLAGIRWVFGGWDVLSAKSISVVHGFTQPRGGLQDWVWILYRVYGLLAAVFLPFSFAATLSLVAISLVLPQFRVRPFQIQPGVLACNSAALGFVLACLSLAMLHVSELEKGLSLYETFQAWWFVVNPLAGSAVLGSWATLVISNQWRPQPTCVDRLGRILGAYWIAASILPIWLYCECRLQSSWM